MPEGLEVVIKYRGAKYNQVASPATVSSEFAILKKDLAHLRVHSPSQKNVRRVNGSFVLQWPGTVLSTKHSLHTRWFKLCSDDPEALKLRKFLSIESITLRQDGVFIASTTGPGQASQDAPPGPPLAGRLGNTSQGTTTTPQPPVATPIWRPARAWTPSPLQPPPPPPLPPPPLPAAALKLPPSAPRSDRRAPPPPPGPDMQMLFARMSGSMSDASLRSTNTQPQHVHVPISPRADRPGDTAQAAPSPLARDDGTLSAGAKSPTLPVPPEPEITSTSPVPHQEPDDMSPPVPLPAFVLPSSSSGALTGLAAPFARSSAPSSPTLPVPPPYLSSVSSGNGDQHVGRLRERHVSRLMRELWDTRRQRTALQAREKVILDDLERLGARPEGDLRDDLARLEAELRAERARRARAEQALSDVERECRTPFVVPALLQAFLSISELSS